MSKIDLERCCDCEHAYFGGFPEAGDGYTKCQLLEEIVFYEYRPTYADENLECPLDKTT